MNELEEKARALSPYLIALREAIESESIRLLIAELLDVLDEIEEDRTRADEQTYSEDF